MKEDYKFYFFDGGKNFRNFFNGKEFSYLHTLEEAKEFIEDYRKKNNEFDIWVKTYQILILKRYKKGLPWEVVEIINPKRKLVI